MDIKIVLFLCLTLSINAFASESASVHIAVSSNFLTPLKSLTKEFTHKTGIPVYLSNGASGMLYAKIKRGAPYDMFFSADARRPQLLEKEGAIEKGSRFTYVTGRLVLWSPNEKIVLADLSKLNPEDLALRYLAMANPKIAPYGVAAVSVLKHYGLYHALLAQQKIALGESVGKAYQYVATGNAQLGLVAKSYVSNPLRPVKGRVFDVPTNLYPLLEQQAVIIKGRKTPEVIQFLTFFKSHAVQERLQRFGYGLPTFKQSAL